MRASSRSMPRSRRQHLSSVSSRLRLVVQQRAEVDPRVRVVPVERLVDLPRALAADQRPVGGLRRAGVEEVHLRVDVQPRAPAREQVVVGAGRELAQVDRHEVELDRRQVLVVLEHGPRHVHELRRVRRHHLHHPDRAIGAGA